MRCCCRRTLADGAAELEARAEFDAFDLRKARMLRPEVSLEWMISGAWGAEAQR